MHRTQPLYRILSGRNADGSAIIDAAGTVSAVKLGAGALTSGESQLQGSTIQFTAKANTGYEIAGWKLNGNARYADRKRYLSNPLAERQRYSGRNLPSAAENHAFGR